MSTSCLRSCPPRIGKTGLFVLLLLCHATLALAESMDHYTIGAHGQANLKYPAWFKQSFFDLREDLSDARKAGKRGVIVFFSQKSCNHCQAFIDTTLNDPATRARVQKQYDVVGLDIFNDLELTDIDGTVTTIKDFAELAKARLTPTLIFYGIENKPLLKIIGFYPPEKFNRVLDYIDGGYGQHVSLSQYLRNSKSLSTPKIQGIQKDEALFAQPPYQFARNKSPADRPLLVVFENPQCETCQRFHQRVLDDPQVRQLAKRFDTAQLDMTDIKSQVVLPDGRSRTPRQWADELQLNYDVAVVFFDEQGQEVHRLDAETGRDRMTGSMQYVLEKAYLIHEQFLRWRRDNAIRKKNEQ